MDEQQSQSFDPQTISSEVFQSYWKALDHMAPDAIKVFLEKDVRNVLVLPSEDNPRVTIPLAGQGIHIFMEVKFPLRIAGSPPQPVWRLPSLCRMMRAMWIMVSNTSRPCEAWPAEIEVLWAAVVGRFTEELSLNLLAMDLDLSEGYLGGRFTHFLGSSFRQLLAEERVAFAARQLVGTSRKIEDIAKETSLSLSQFNRIFISLTGMSPRDYRKTIAPPKMIFRR